MQVKFPKNIIYGIGVVAVIVVLFIFSKNFISGRSLTSGASLVNIFRSESSYQAVFLANNQVYFGKLSNASSRYPTLKDIYYLRVSQQLQPQDPNATESQIQLVKLGSEIHGPTTDMKINRDQILFVEDLKSDSQVVKAILDQKKSNESQKTE